jgi:hypothetical protein
MSFNAPAKARTVHYRMLYPQVLRSSPPRRYLSDVGA